MRMGLEHYILFSVTAPFYFYQFFIAQAGFHLQFLFLLHG